MKRKYLLICSCIFYFWGERECEDLSFVLTFREKHMEMLVGAERVAEYDKTEREIVKRIFKCDKKNQDQCYKLIYTLASCCLYKIVKSEYDEFLMFYDEMINLLKKKFEMQ